MVKRTNIHALDDKVAASLPTPTKGCKIYFDKKITGFGVRVMATGGRAYVLNYRSNVG